ncbi:MAG: energy transducer TonB [Burkholderiales bacterium]|nr:energy transducer TonB [Burkholderiales bacterium]
MTSADWKRLYAASLFSCLLHAALLVPPYLGVVTGVSGTAPPGAQMPVPASALSAMLAPEDQGALAPPGLSTDGKGGAAPARAIGAEQRPGPLRAEGIGQHPLPATTRYYTADQLSKRPRPVDPPELDAPELRPIMAAGTVVLKLWINELGYVVSIEVEKTDLPEIFSRAAVAAFKKLRFTPGELDGRRVASLMRIEVSYEDDRIAPPGASSGAGT